MNNEMAQRSNRRSQNPDSEAVFQDCITKWEESVAHSILARSTVTPPKAVYICANQPCPSHFSLASRRRTIHSEYPTIREVSREPGRKFYGHSSSERSPFPRCQPGRARAVEGFNGFGYSMAELALMDWPWVPLPLTMSTSGTDGISTALDRRTDRHPGCRSRLGSRIHLTEHR